MWGKRVSLEWKMEMECSLFSLRCCRWVLLGFQEVADASVDESCWSKLGFGADLMANHLPKSCVELNQRAGGSPSQDWLQNWPAAAVDGWQGLDLVISLLD
jgi:hypothetical protein